MMKSEHYSLNIFPHPGEEGSSPDAE
jgi:hypothetical protein